MAISMNLDWRYLPYKRQCKAISGNIHQIWVYMVQYLHFRVLKFPYNYLICYIYIYISIYTRYINLIILWVAGFAALSHVALRSRRAASDLLRHGRLRPLVAAAGPAGSWKLELMDGLELHQLMVYPIIQYLNFVDMDDGINHQYLSMLKISVESFSVEFCYQYLSTAVHFGTHRIMVMKVASVRKY